MAKAEKIERAKVFPHQGVYTQLLASKVRKKLVGVFAIFPIPKGVDPFPTEATELVWVSKKKLKALNLPPGVYEMYDRFGATEGDRQYAPVSFANPGQAWQVRNNRKNPNLEYGDDDRFHALRNIKPGEELTMDESIFDE